MSKAKSGEITITLLDTNNEVHTIRREFHSKWQMLFGFLDLWLKGFRVWA